MRYVALGEGARVMFCDCKDNSYSDDFIYIILLLLLILLLFISPVTFSFEIKIGVLSRHTC